MKKIIFFLVFIILISSIITTIIIENNRIIEVAEYVMDVQVVEGQHVGFNVDPDGFHFGMIPKGSAGSRELVISNSSDDALVTITKKGDMRKWVTHPNNFIIKKDQMTEVMLRITIPNDAPLGNYSGTVIIKLRKV